eukprot:gene7855-5482_t
MRKLTHSYRFVLLSAFFLQCLHPATDISSPARSPPLLLTRRCSDVLVGLHIFLFYFILFFKTLASLSLYIYIYIYILFFLCCSRRKKTESSASIRDEIRIHSHVDPFKRESTFNFHMQTHKEQRTIKTNPSPQSNYNPKTKKKNPSLAHQRIHVHRLGTNSGESKPDDEWEMVLAVRGGLSA